MHGGGAFPRKGGRPPEEGRGSAAHHLEIVMAMEVHMGHAWGWSLPPEVWPATQRGARVCCAPFGDSNGNGGADGVCTGVEMSTRAPRKTTPKRCNIRVPCAGLLSPGAGLLAELLGHNFLYISPRKS